MSQIIDKLAWTPIRNRAVLFARSRGQTLFYTVGGKREPGESDEQALIREVLEETGTRLLTDTIRHRQTFLGAAHGKYEGRVVRLTCYDADAEGEPTPRSEVEELAYFTSADMHRTTPTGQAVLRWFIEQNLID